MFKLATAAALVATASATIGVDISAAASESDFECMINDGVAFAIPRVYRSTGSVDPNGAQSVINAHNAGIKYVDGYIFPCYSCGDGAGQVSDALSNLKSAGASIGTLWLDIEGTQYWSSSTSNNVAFIQDMIDECSSKRQSCGIYTSESQWSPITGGATTGGSLPLWYAHYDDSQSFSDFSAFGGWSKPAMKQYKGDTTLCGVGVDLSWY